MQLLEIDKTRYRKHLNVITIGLVLGFITLAITFGALLIALFGAAPTINGESTGNFNLNLLGVFLATAVAAGVIWQVKQRPYFVEVYYVSQLKMLQNRIYRQFKKIKTAAAAHDVEALIILSFYYKSLQQVYTLDDNTLTISKLETDINWLNDLIAAQSQPVSPELFNTDMLKTIS